MPSSSLLTEGHKVLLSLLSWAAAICITLGEAAVAFLVYLCEREGVLNYWSNSRTRCCWNQHQRPCSFFPQACALACERRHLGGEDWCNAFAVADNSSPGGGPEVCGLASLRGETVQIEQGGGGPPQTGDIHYNTMDKTGNE